MNDKNVCYEEVETKHKKKSKSRGMPRSKHKHQYEDALVIGEYHTTDFKTGRPCVKEIPYVDGVCTICGYTGGKIKGKGYYEKTQVDNLPNVYKDVLTKKAMNLPKWRKDFFDKFAVKMED